VSYQFIGAAFRDRTFSLVDRTSFAVMERLGIAQAASFDNDFAVYRYGRNRGRAFGIVRTAPSETFQLFHQAILERKQVILIYKGHRREVCPHILGHKDGVEKVLTFQFTGGSSHGAQGAGGWKCLEVAKVQDARLQEGRWHGDSSHRKTQRCVDDVYIDVNTDVPNQPGRR
jgi:hypothetical protein